MISIDAWIAVRRDDELGAEFIDTSSFSLHGEAEARDLMAIYDKGLPKEYRDHYPVARIAHVKITEVEASEC